MEDTLPVVESDKKQGGEGGGVVAPKLRLKRSELLILRQHADRYPVKDEDRQKVVDVVMDTLITAETPRNKIAAAQTMIALDRVNLEEVKVCLSMTDDKPTGAGVNVNVTNTVMAGNSVQLVDITSDEFKALPVSEQLRLTRDAIQAMNG